MIGPRKGSTHLAPEVRHVYRRRHVLVPKAPEGRHLLD